MEVQAERSDFGIEVNAEATESMAEEAEEDGIRINEDDVRINVDAVADELQSMVLSSNSSISSPRCCIFRVPNTLLVQNPKAYKPKAFSIGPFHYGEPHLEATQKIKAKYLCDLISRLPDPHESTLRHITAAIDAVQPEAREHYEEPLNMTRDEFVKVLVLDGCFLVELFLKFTYKYLANEVHENSDPIFGMSSVQQLLNHDLMLLENQIPWCVLETLLNIIKTPENRYPLRILVITFFRDIFSKSIELVNPLEYEYAHILDLMRSLMLVVRRNKPQNTWKWMTTWEPMPLATSLQEAGIKFRRATTSTTTILDIKFEDGVLEIPPLHIHERTESLFRNLICYEQCLPNCEGVITAYAILMDNLINTAQDMEILCQSKVIDNWLDNKDAAEFFNKLYDDIGVCPTILILPRG